MRSTLFLARPAHLAGFAALLVLSACGDDSSPSGTQSVPDSGSSPDAQNTADSGAATEAGDDDAATSPTPAAPVSFRIAHLSPDAPPFDVCLAPQGTTAFQGPFLSAFAAATAAANGTGGSSDDSGALPDAAVSPATGLIYGQVSAYFVIDQACVMPHVAQLATSIFPASSNESANTCATPSVIGVGKSGYIAYE